MSFLTMGLVRKLIPNIKNETEGDRINEIIEGDILDG
jgi:hypothetical protein